MKESDATVCSCFVEKVFLEMLQNSPETPVPESLLNKKSPFF